MHGKDHERVKQHSIEIQNLADGEVSEIDYRIAHKKVNGAGFAHTTQFFVGMRMENPFKFWVLPKTLLNINKPK
jgi:hypothetical protein